VFYEVETKTHRLRPLPGMWGEGNGNTNALQGAMVARGYYSLSSSILGVACVDFIKHKNMSW